MLGGWELEVQKIMPMYAKEFFCWERIYYMINDR